jgi:hypothetical protein
MPDDLDGVAACVSPGVSTEVGFDRDIADSGIDVYLADASVAGPPIQHERFRFTPKFLDTYNSETTITLNDYCQKIGDGKSDLILQMDIEGAEYRVLATASEQVLRRFRIMVIEFHRLDRLYSRAAFPEIKSVFMKLLCNHRVVHIHPNNFLAPVIRLGIPPVLEFTFYRSDRDVFERKLLRFPHPLDAPNDPKAPSLVLPDCWYWHSN